MIIEPKIRNSICMTAHPEGCEKAVLDQIDYVKAQGAVKGCKAALVIGCSTGYGLASRISAGFAAGAGTIGVSFEKAPSGKRPGTPGFYNNRAYDKAAESAGLASYTFNGDAFSDEMKNDVIAKIKETFGKVDLIVYSLASPVRKDPATGELFRSVLKPLGDVYTARSADIQKKTISMVSFEPGTEQEAADTVKVMGGEDWELWIKALKEAGVIEDHAVTLAYSYIGPKVTFPVYRQGTIGKAKDHLEATAKKMTKEMTDISLEAYVSVNKALVTRSSAVIPVVSLYISLLYKIMKAKGIHEECIEQIYRLFNERLYTGGKIPVDNNNLIRIDDLEMRQDVQEAIEKIWDQVNEENLPQMADLDGYWNSFLKLHGFGVEGVDYSKEVSLE